MSSARKRRAELVQNPPPPGGGPKLVPAFNAGVSSQQQNPKQLQGHPTQPTNGVHMTLQQIINITDKRLTTLEKQMIETNRSLADNTKNAEAPAAPSAATAEIEELFEGFNILMNEVSQIKETLMKLQTYTLDVNHVLLESKIGKNNPELIPTPPPIIDSDAKESDNSEDNEAADDVVEPAPAPEPEPVVVEKSRTAGVRRRK